MREPSHVRRRQWDLGAAEVAAFEAGREDFESAETAEGGLGPIFNGVSSLLSFAADAYRRLSDAEQKHVLDFLNSI